MHHQQKDQLIGQAPEEERSAEQARNQLINKKMNCCTTSNLDHLINIWLTAEPSTD
jgi:hypothetical protein